MTLVPILRRSLLTLPFAVILSLILVGGASAGKGWCIRDPTADIGGVTHHFEVAVLFPDDGSGHATGATFVMLGSPRPITNIHHDDGIDGMGETVEAQYARKNTFAAQVPANGSFQMALFYDDKLLRDNCTTNQLCSAYF